jgi:serine/threonine protein kinase
MIRPQQPVAQYQITTRIGSGGMGEVFRARETRLNRDVAIKVLPRDFAQDADRLRRFEQEAKTLAARSAEGGQFASNSFEFYKLSV